jgi:hypothetical protein
MKRSPTLSLLIALALGLPPLAAAAERTTILAAINQVENPANLTRPGAKGELGPYQFRRGTWKMHTTEPFSRANHRAIADEVAEKHFEWIKRGLAKAGMAASPYNIALAWNGGLHAATTRRAPSASHRYATRVANLVAEAERRQSVAALDRIRTMFAAPDDAVVALAR